MLLLTDCLNCGYKLSTGSDPDIRALTCIGCAFRVVLPRSAFKMTGDEIVHSVEAEFAALLERSG